MHFSTIRRVSFSTGAGWCWQDLDRLRDGGATLAEAGRRVLLVCNDPVSDVGQVLDWRSATRSPRCRRSKGFLRCRSTPRPRLRGTGKHHRTDPRRACGRLREGEPGAAVWRLHQRDRRFRRGHGAADGCRSHDRCRSHHLRHRSHGANHPSASTAGRGKPAAQFLATSAGAQ